MKNFTKAERIEITGNAIANRLKGRSLSGAALLRKIEEVADDMHDADTIAGETLRSTFENDETGRDWKAIVRQAKKTLTAIGG